MALNRASGFLPSLSRLTKRFGEPLTGNPRVLGAMNVNQGVPNKTRGLFSLVCGIEVQKIGMSKLFLKNCDL
ncbi:hypothetical protein Sinac_5454 [Singulisphaera acidiphila DSM 18658]|uniref:Uncharacterized protein n=1 Tax=Singulisphaera acidiphila (strain ATCC BAA-1392 / DSM 18658 / VKM B-2454 / MOB10) TaxID=886293 RepID=L0DL95_SINAD|nr:hypothetical protein Sinac_5454 [Singulisphaera acidiphila DSM 18658]